jgi:predicted RNA-binding Zn-ribbon protein involved in translation (DUF1610 family)
MEECKMKRKQLTIKYELGHSYTFWYEKTKLYCPNCGKQEVWMQDDGGYVYVGEEYFCLNCYANFCLPILDVPKNKNEIKDWQKQQIIEGLKSL